MALSPSELKQQRILIADRHASARSNLRALLSKAGFSSIQMASSSQEMIKRCEENFFDIIISDFQLEDRKDGIYLLEELRGLHLLPLTCVYVVTTSERTHQNVMAIAEQTPDAYVIKPFSTETFLSRLMAAIEKKRFCYRVFELLEQQLYLDALMVCDQLLLEPQKFQIELFRIKGHILIRLERYDEASELYVHVLSTTQSPFAHVGLARALRGQGKQADAKMLTAAIIEKNKAFMEAYDFLADLHEEMGMLPEAQAILQSAAAISPKNTQRHQTIGDMAVRNKDAETAEKSYSRVLEARRGSPLSRIDDYMNLARVSLQRGRTDGARRILEDIKRDWRDDKQAKFAALTVESLCLTQENLPARAAQVLKQAAQTREDLLISGEPNLSQKLLVDFGKACLSIGEEELASHILGQVAAENYENQSVIAQIQEIFVDSHKEEDGKNLLAKVGREIIEMNNAGVMAARGGNLAVAVNILIETAERVPNLLFLVNASKAIFTLLDKKGWDDELAEKGLTYLRRAYRKDSKSMKVLSASNLYQQVAKRYGQEIQPIDAIFEYV